MSRGGAGVIGWPLRLLLAALGVLILPVTAVPSSLFSPDGFFDAISRIAVRSAPRIGTVVGQDYPALPDDVTELVLTRYPRLHEDLYRTVERRYPSLYNEALRYVHRRHPGFYAGFQSDLVREKKTIESGRQKPSDLFWAKLDQQHKIRIDVWTHLDGLHPEIKLDVLNRVNRNHPGLKADLFKLVASRYPGIIWEVGKILAAETVDEIKK